MKYIRGVICICCSALVLLQSPRNQTSIFPRPILFHIIHNNMLLTYINPQRAPDTRRFSRNSSNVIPFSGDFDGIRYYLLKLLYQNIIVCRPSRVRPPTPNPLLPHSHIDNTTDCNSFDLLLRVTSQTNVPPLSRSYTIVLTLCTRPRVYYINI